MMNDPRVYMNLSAPPFPYAQKDWESFFPIVQKSCSDALTEWNDIEESKKEAVKAGREEMKRWMSALPINCLREIDLETDEQRFIGNLGIRKAEFLDVKDKEERKRLQEENKSRKAGDPLVQWEVGCESP